MSEAHTGIRSTNAIHCEVGNAARLSAADFLYFAATPTFAVMALLTGVLGGDALCSMTGTSPLAGMMPMYLLMSAFHSAPWLKLIAGQRRRAGRS